MGGTLSLLVSILILAMVLSSTTSHSAHDQPGGYQQGETIRFQCKTPGGDWGPAPTCIETREEMQFKYGVDHFQFCGWSIDDDETLAYLSSLIQQEANWNCRIAMIPGKAFYLPFTIPVWGLVESDHIHIDNHLNFVFHGAGGHILGVAAYPVRDNFQYGKVGSIITIHGPVKWFHQGTFQSLTSNKFTDAPRSALPLVLAWSAISFMFSLVVCGVFYRFVLRPQIYRTLLKTKKLD
eukprot:TRINITY_DN2787_c1_g2_i2.p1 TRINITY_DN2787_c1_g2~~TRINITY_DN2787_c1_g2_i2.p1  ORF type:complete len:237 (-),score=31.68 TRINITY_DN2787_c1_g2_i2:143-853(-)